MARAKAKKPVVRAKKPAVKAKKLAVKTKKPPAKPKAKTPAAIATDIERDGLQAAMGSYTDGGYPIVHMRFPVCACGSDRFQVSGDDEEGCASRRCVACKTEHMICDSAEYWDDADPEQCICVCERDEFQVGVGFAITTDKKDLRWIYVGMRCVHCGLAGVYLDWKIDYGPSLPLVEQA